MDYERFILEDYLEPYEPFLFQHELTRYGFEDVTEIRDYFTDNCNATGEFSDFILKNNNITYYPVAENENWMSTIAEELKLKQSDYKIIVSCTFIGSFLVAMYLASVTIPSYVSQVLRFRSGDLPSLGHADFYPLRKRLDLATSLFASSIWGALFATMMAAAFSIGVVRTDARGSIFVAEPGA